MNSFRGGESPGTALLMPLALKGFKGVKRADVIHQNIDVCDRALFWGCLWLNTKCYAYKPTNGAGRKTRRYSIFRSHSLNKNSCGYSGE
jgi:hypothetical protein